MKISSRDINNFLDGPATVNGCLIYGPDRGRIRQYADKIMAHILTDIVDPFNRADLTYEILKEEPRKLAEEVAAISFTGDRRLIVVRDAKDGIFAAIEEAILLLSDMNYLLVMADELPARSKLRAVFEKEKRLAALPCYRDEGVDLEQLICQTLKGYGMHTQENVTSYLAEQLGGDRMLVLSELEKLSLYAMEEESVSYEMARHVVDTSGDKGLDDVCRAIADGQIAGLHMLFVRLTNEGIQPVMILRSVLRYFSRLYMIYGLMEDGQSLDMAIKSIRPPVFFKEVPHIKRYIRRWNKKKVARAMGVLQEAELRIKQSADQPELLCHHYLQRLARAA